MRAKEKRESENPHVLIFPLPWQGHVNTMLPLAELLALSDVHVTFLCTHRFLRFAGHIRARHPILAFEIYVDRVTDPPVFGGNIDEFFNGVKFQGKLKLRELCLEHSGKPRVNRIRADTLVGGPPPTFETSSEYP
ncbi:uncharacterized protein LOC129321363 [Prosopis cineraria]|uniref:uncharacterized protein LOC129321363 n=1 Tax=Prosopis cineraria TaxID=364024 RepID=UPI00240F5D2F|nr:uncharacterized protein LOC129321363 [Prosopis cineraria]